MEASLYVAGQTGEPEAGERLIVRLVRTCERIASSPRIGRDRSDLRDRMRSFAVPPHIIFYRPGRDRVNIMRIVHERQDLREIFPKRKRKSP